MNPDFLTELEALATKYKVNVYGNVVAFIGDTPAEFQFGVANDPANRPAPTADTTADATAETAQTASAENTEAASTDEQA